MYSAVAGSRQEHVTQHIFIPVALLCLLNCVNFITDTEAPDRFGEAGPSTSGAGCFCKTRRGQCIKRVAHVVLQSHSVIEPVSLTVHHHPSPGLR